MSESERVWLIERTRISTDYQHVTAYSAAAAMEIVTDGPPHKWLVKKGLAERDLRDPSDRNQQRVEDATR